MISGELEILKQKGLLSDNNTVQASYKDISNAFQESILNTEVLLAFLRDHSPVFISYNKMKNKQNGKGFWK